jgi:adenylate cyclase class 2
MGKDQREIELKLYVPNLDEVRQRLEAADAERTGERVLERNNRYDDGKGSLAGAGDVLRLRQDSRVRLTFKQGSDRQQVGDAMSRFEAEVEIADFDAMDTILKRLGYRPYMVYEKYRTTYTLDEVEIVLDELPYGNFVEIEGDGEAIQAVRVKLGLGEARSFTSGYTELFRRVKASLGLKMNDLTFENFKGITVPESAFEAPV